MTDTPRTKQLKEVRQKRLEFLEKIAEKSNGEPVSTNGIRSSRTERTVRKSINDERVENSGLKDAAGKSSLSKLKSGKNSGDLESLSYPTRSSVVSGSRSRHDLKPSNDSGLNKSENNLQRIDLVEKCAKKTPREVTVVASCRQSTKNNTVSNELRLFNDISSKRLQKESGVDSANKVTSLSKSVTLSSETVSSDAGRKAGSSSQTEEDKRKSYDLSHDGSTYVMNVEQPGMSRHLNANSISDSISSKKSARQGFDTYRIKREDLPEKSGVAKESDLVSLNPVTSRRPSVKPVMSQSKYFGSSEVVKMDASTDAKNALSTNFEEEKRQKSDDLGWKDGSGKAASSSVPLRKSMPLNSVTLANEDLARLFKSSKFSLCDQDLGAGSSFDKTSSVGTSSGNGKSDQALTQSRNSSLTKSQTKSSVSIQMDHNGNSKDKGVCSNPRQSDPLSSSASSSLMRSVAGENRVDDSIKLLEENDETLMKHLSKSVLSSGDQVLTSTDLQPPPSESVEYKVPDFVKNIPKVNAVQRSQIPICDSNDFLSSLYVGPNSDAPASETLVSTMASTLNFGSANLELVLGKDRMERLLKNIMEIDGSSDFSPKECKTTDISASDSYDAPPRLEDKPPVLTDSGAFEVRGSHGTDSLGCVLNGAQASSESLHLKTHRPGDASCTLLNSSSSSSIRAKKEQMKYSFLTDEIYAEAQMLKDGHGCRSRSDVAMAKVPDVPAEVRNRPATGFVDAQNACDVKGTRADLLSEEVTKAEAKGFIDSAVKKKHQRREAEKRDAMANSKDEHVKGIRRKMLQQLQGNEEHLRPEGNDSAPVTCYMNPAIDRYFKSLENLSCDRESLLPKAPLEKSLEDGLELSAVGRSLRKEDAPVADAGDGFRQRSRDTKKDLFQTIDHNDGMLFRKISPTVDVVYKDEDIQRQVSDNDQTLESSLANGGQRLEAGKRSENTKSRSSPEETQSRNIVANVSTKDPLLSTLVKTEEMRLSRNHRDDAITGEKMQSSNAVDSSCTATSVWKTDETSDGKIPGTSDISSSSLSCGMKKVDKKPVFTPILNVRDSEEFEYSDLGRRGMGSFGEFFKDEMSINLRDSGDVSRSRNSSVFPQPPLKSIVEDCAMDSVNFDYVVENKLNFSEELKATLHLDLADSLDVEKEQQRMGKKDSSDVIEVKEDKSQQKKSSKTGPLRKSLSRSSERQQGDAVISVPQNLKQEESVPATKSSKSQRSAAEDASAKNDDFYRDFVHHLVNDARFKKTGLESKSSESLSAPHVPKLQLNIDSSLPLKSVSRSLAKTSIRPSSAVSSSKSRPFVSQSSVLGKAKVAWKEDDLVVDVSASPLVAPLLRQRPWSAKILPRNSFPDDSSVAHSSLAPELSKSVGEAASIRRKRPSSVGPRKRLISSDAEPSLSIDDFGGRHFQTQRRSPLAQSVQVNKTKGQSRQVFRFASEDYEKYSALSPRIQAGELSMLTSFPDEILLKIFSYLPRPSLSQCARVCQHFFRVAMDNSLWKCIELEERVMTDEHLAAIGRKMPSSLVLFQCTGDKVTSNGLRQLFWECSESLRELRFSGCSKGHLTGENILLHATNRCRNITHLDGSWTNLSSQSIIAFSEESERLVSVCLNGCQSINDEAVQTLVSRHGKRLVTLELLGLFGLTNVAVETICNCCSNLVTLTLGQCWKLTDSCLARLSTNMPLLENLDLRGCKQIKDQTIHQLVKNCGQLTTFSLANCPNLTDSSLAEIAVQCPRLRSLDVCGCTKLTNVGLKTLISGCSMLKYLDLSSTAINHRSVTAIASYCSRRLEVLKLNFCKQINMECLIRLTKNCKRLKKLYLYGVKGLHSIQELKMTNPNVWIEM